MQTSNILKTDHGLKVLFVHEVAGSQGGAEISVMQAAAGLTAQGHQCCLIYERLVTDKSQGWTDAFQLMWRLEGQNKAMAVEHFLDRQKPDVICINKETDVATLQCIAESGIPTVQIIHDHSMYCVRNYRYNPLTRTPCNQPLGRHCIFPCGAICDKRGIHPNRFRARQGQLANAKRFHRIIAVSAHIRQQLILNGIDPKRILVKPALSHIPTADEIPAQDQNRIIFMGQLIRGKGVDLLIESLKYIETPYECIILGDGSHRAYCEKKTRRLKLTNHVKFVGHIPHKEITRQLAGAAVVAVPSAWDEPFGLVGVEAMAQGLPVVAFDCGGISDWLENNETGILVPRGDTKAFGKALNNLLTNKDVARKMGRNGMEAAKTKFNFQDHIRWLEQLFLELCPTKKQ